MSLEETVRKTNLFTTAKAGLGINVGTGSTLEITSNDDVRFVTVSGYREALVSAGIPLGRLNQEDICDCGNGYVTATFYRDNFINRFEMNDLLNGGGWKLSGYTTSQDSYGLTIHEIWSLHIKSKKHDK